MKALLCPSPLLALTLAITLAGCYREEREFNPKPSGEPPSGSVQMSVISPGAPNATPPAGKQRYEENAYAVSQGKRLFKAYNCAGCHAQGGGNMGPALMDDKWIYGDQPQQIYATIEQGRPNGMPAFGKHIPEDQIWQLVAYVRSMSGQLKSDVAPGRSDGLQAGPSEQRREKEQPKNSSLPTSSRQ